MKVKIKGIYSTAIANLLIKNGFEIVSSSERLISRLNIKESKGADTLIYNKEDLNGLVISGKSASKVVKVLLENLPNIFIQKKEIGAIYCGIIKRIDQRRKKIYIDIGLDKEGIVDLSQYWGILKEGEKVLVQIKKVDKNYYYLSTQLRMFGDNLILIRGGFSKISEFIKDEKERERLQELSKYAKEKDYNVLWKALAEGKSDEELKEEIAKLIEEENVLREKLKECNEAKKLREGNVIYFVEFSKEAKEKLDELRKEVTPTVKNHHVIKSAGYFELIEFADRLCGEFDEERVYSVMEGVLKDNLNSCRKYKVVIKRINGKEIEIVGKVIEMGEVIRLRSKKRGKRGYYIVTIDYNNNKVESAYYEKDEEIDKKEFLTTGIEIHPRFARTICVGIKSKNGLDIEAVKELHEEGLTNFNIGAIRNG